MYEEFILSGHYVWWVPKIKKKNSYQILFFYSKLFTKKFFKLAKLAIRKLKINALVVSLIEIDPKFTTKTFKYTTTNPYQMQ